MCSRVVFVICTVFFGVIHSSEGKNKEHEHLYKNITCVKKSSSESRDLATVVHEMMNILLWRRPIINYDVTSSSTVKQILTHQDSTHLPTTTLLRELGPQFDSSAMKSLLYSLHKQFFSELQFLLIADTPNTFKFLKLVDRFDEETKRTTDYRHYSYWLVICSTRCSPGPHLHIQHLENVLLISSSESKYPTIWQLTTAGGRSFSNSKSIDTILQEHDMFPNTKYGFNNRELIVSTLDEKYIVEPSTDGFVGYSIEILNAMATHLNFSYRVIYPKDKKWGTEVNGSWDGVTGQLQRREIDISLASLLIHEDREKVMDFLYPPIFTSKRYCVCRLHPNVGGRWQIYLKRFTPLVYVVIVLSLLTITMLTYLVIWLDGGTEDRFGAQLVPEEPHRIINICIFTFGIILNRAVDTHPLTQANRLVIFTWSIFAMVLAAYFSANLVATFAVNKSNLPFTNLAELVNQKEYKWGLQSGNIGEHIFRSSKTGDMKLAWEGVLEDNKTDPDVLSTNVSKHLKKFMTEKYCFLMYSLMYKDVKRENCDIRAIDQVIIWEQIGIGVPTGYPLRKELERVLSMLMDSGLPALWWQRWGKTEQNKCYQSDRVTPLTLSDVASAFYLLGVGLGLAWGVLMLEKIKRRTTNQTN